ncbi:MAG: hypothetical protein RSB77_05520 [Bacilli bacterium]
MKKIIIEQRNKFNLINILVTLLLAFIIYFIALPACNIQSIGFWVYIISIIGIYIFLNTITGINEKGSLVDNIKIITYLTGSIGVLIMAIIVINFFFSPIFNSKSYANRIKVDKSEEFLKDVEKVNFDHLPLLDKNSSQKLGDRVMGQMPELVSQFYVSDLYTQINYNNEIVRVTPLEYNGFFKYLANYKKGVKGYITVNSVNGKSKLVKLKEGMKYMPSAMIMKNLDRKLRFTYPTKFFGEESFELDNEGNPYWIIPTLKFSGIELKRDVEGLIILNPITGESKYYKVKDVPRWVDHVYSASMIIEQLNDWGLYTSGFINSLFGQKNVVKSTEGYNYTLMNDDVYLYTGITSVASDEANLGFILSNMRTKETKFYAVPGAQETSAMGSAKGQVQQMNYTPTFPLLINLNNKATYLISLKDNAGLVKMYAFVDVLDYQKVAVTDASKGIEAAAQAYLGDIEIADSELTKKTITIKTISTATISSNTYYFITDESDNKYYVSIKVSKSKLPFLKVGDTLKISYKGETELKEINKIG